MRNLDIDMVKKRIYSLMQENRVTQETLSAELGMTQPNFSRALSLKNSQCFTLEQVYKLAQYFDVSVDYLLENSKPADKKSEREICELFTALLEARKIVKIEHTREEEVYAPEFLNNYPDCVISKKQVTYNAFLFPSYLDPGPLDRFDEEQIDNLHTDVLMDGNADDSNIRINTFFARYFQIYDLFLHNQMNQELFHEITEKFMGDLK